MRQNWTYNYGSSIFGLDMIISAFNAANFASNTAISAFLAASLILRLLLALAISIISVCISNSSGVRATIRLVANISSVPKAKTSNVTNVLSDMLII